MGMAGIPWILQEIRGNGDRCCGNTQGWKWEGAAVIPWGWNLFLQEPHRDALEVFQMIKICVQALEYYTVSQ